MSRPDGWPRYRAGPDPLELKRMARCRRWVRAVGIALGVASFLWLFPGLDEVGITWDEPRYFASVVRIQEWAERVIHGPDRAAALTRDGIRAVWDVDRYWNPHPPAYKEAMAVTEAVVGPRYGSVVGYRTASLLWFALLVVAVTWFAGGRWGLPAGVGSGLALLGMPRLLGHAHIAATDMPLTLFWFVATAGLALYVRGGRARDLWIGGVALGLAMATKFTGWLTPIPLLFWLALTPGRRRALGAAVLWGLAGLGVAYALDPLAWHEPIREIGRLFAESLLREERVPIYTYYLGRVWEFELPWHHAIVMTAVTVPVGILALSALGTGAALRRVRRDRLGLLCVIQVLFFWALLALPESPNHDGVRLFLPMFPFVALLAGLGFSRLADAGARFLPEGVRGGRLLAPLLLGLLFFYPPYLQATRIAPLYLEYYNEAIGREAGASRAGMEATYWLDTVTPAFLARVNEVLPQGARLAGFPSPDHYVYLQAYGMIRPDVKVVEEGSVSWLILVARKALFEPVHWGIYEKVKPTLAVEVDGVEVTGLYRWSERDADPPVTEEP